MNHRRARAAAAMALAVGLGAGALGGCSDGGLSDREQAYADAFARDLGGDDGRFGVTEDEARCMGEALIEELGADPFEDAGVDPEDIPGGEAPGQLLGDGVVTDDQAEAVIAAWHECADLAAGFAGQASDDFSLDEGGLDCFEGALREDDVLDRYLQVSFTSDQPGEAEAVLGQIVQLVQGCTSADGGGGILVDSIARSLAQDGRLTEDQARCVAQQVVDVVGAERLLEITGIGAFETAPPEVQDELAQAIIEATGACGIPPTQLDG